MGAKKHTGKPRDPDAATAGPAVLGIAPADLPRAEAVLAGAAIAAGKLAYDVGKDLVPRLRGTQPVLIRFRSSVSSGDYAIVGIRLLNVSFHTLYIEAVTVSRPEGATVVSDLPDPEMSLGARRPTLADRMASPHGPLPWELQPGDTHDFSIFAAHDRMPDDIRHKPCGRMALSWSALDLENSVTSKDIAFRIRL